MNYNSYIFLIQGCLLVYFTNVQAQNTLKINHEPIVKHNLDDNLIALCSVSGNWTGTDPVIKWYDEDGEEVPTSTAESEKAADPDRLKEAQTVSGGTGSKLKVYRIKVEDAGSWTCKDTGGTNAQAEIRLEIRTNIVITAEPVQEITLGREGMVSCIAKRVPDIQQEGAGRITVAWGKDGVAYESMDEDFKARTQQTVTGLKIQNAKATDEGLYTCDASDFRSGDVKTIQLIIYVPPKIETSPSRAAAKTGQPVSFICKASGKPLPTYEWYKGNAGSPLTGDRYEISENAVTGTNISESTLLIKNVIEEDEDNYKCKATNKVGSEEKVAELKVYIPPEIRELNNVSEKEGTTAKLVCKVYGKPAPQVRWEKFGSGITYEVGNSEVVDNDGSTGEEKTSVNNVIDAEGRETTSTLTINNLQKDDAGKYKCEAQSTEGGSTSQYTYLTVQYKPAFSDKQKSIVYTWAGQIGKIECLARGEPAVSFKWFKDGEEVTTVGGNYKFDTVKDESEGVNDLYKGTLKTIELSYANEDKLYGSYMCLAQNDMGNTNHTVQLRQADKPRNPTVSATEITPSTVDLVVIVAKINNGPQPSKILWNYTEPSNKRSITNEITASPGTKTIYVKNLTPMSSYKFQVQVKSEVGLSDPTQTAFDTLKERPPYKITIRSRPAGSYANKYNLQWDIPKDGGAAITSYTIRYREVTVFENKSSNTNEWQVKEYVTGYEPTITLKNGGLTTKEITGLGANKYYEIEIRANNKEGAGDTASFVVKTKSDGLTNPEAGGQSSADDIGLSIGYIILIIVIVFIVLFVVVDVTCYFRNKCGVIMCLKDRFGAGTSADTRSKEPIMEAGDGNKDTLPIRGIQNTEKDGIVMEDEKTTAPLLSSDVTKDEVDEEDEVGGKKDTDEMEPEDKVEKPETPGDKQVEIGEEAKPAEQAPEATDRPAADGAPTTGSEGKDQETKGEKDASA